MPHHPTDDDLVLHYYGELAAQDEAGTTTHLSTCKDCQRRFRQLQRVLAAVDEHALVGPELPEQFERTVWARLEPNLPATRHRWLSWFVLAPGRLAWVAMIVLLVGAAFMAGRLTPRSTEAPKAAEATTEQIRERILLIDLSDHLEQSQIALIELVNADDRQPLSMSEGRERAAELAAANRLYRQVAAATGDATVADLLEDLEPVLVDVAASPEELSSADLDELRRRIESGSLLFKVRVVSSDLRQRQRTVNHEQARRRSSL